MIDPELVHKALAFIETCLVELRPIDPARLGEDLRDLRFVERTLQIAIQAILDIASHVVAAERLGEPPDLAAVFALLARGGWVRSDQVTTLRAMAGFRNVLVHGYAEVDVAVVRDVLDHRLPDLRGFVATIRGRLQG